MAGSADVPDEIVTRLRSVCLELPEAYEEPAWVGVRWRIRTSTFAHVLRVESGWPPAYARAVGTDESVVALTFRLPLTELEAVTSVGHPFFRARWGREVAGLLLETGVDWDEVAELLSESYCFLAPAKLAEQVVRRSG
ncbi:MAG: MmcQ/YjbR family DNA-binding protein [Actinomycetes bacterium]